MVTPLGPACDRCHRLLLHRRAFVLFWFTHLRFCSNACADAELATRRARLPAKEKPTFSVCKYGTRYWAIYDGAGSLVAVTVYKKGALEVASRLSHS